MGDKLWERVAAAIAERGAALLDGEPLPRERDLAAELGVSRATVRRALGALREQGRIQSRRGQGTFYLREREPSDPWRLPAFSTTEMTEARGGAPTARVLRLRRTTAPRVICEWLELEPGVEAWEVQRLRLRGEGPVSLELSYVPVAVCSQLEAQELVGSLYRLLAEKTGREAASSHQRVSGATLDPHEAQLLDVPEGSAGLRVLNTTYDREGRPFEASLALLPGATAWLDIRLGAEGDRVRRMM